LSETEVAEHYKGIYSNESGLVGYWTFDEGYGTTAHDESGKGNHGTLYGPTWTNNAPRWTQGVKPLSGGYQGGGAMEFDGVDDRVDVSGSQSLNISSMITLEVWVKIDAYPSGAVPQEYSYIVLRVGPTYYEYRIMLYPNGKVDGAFLDGVGWGTSYVLSNTALNLNQWYHVVYTYDKITHRIYINGKEDNTKADTTGGLSFSGTLAIGGSAPYPANRVFDGLIDEVRVYNRALSVEEIRYHYNKGGPVAHWKLDEGNGTTTYDATNNNNDGTLGNGTCSPGVHVSACPAWAQGQYGSALLFDGTDDYLSVATSTSLDVDAPITVEGWFKWQTLVTGRNPLAKYASCSGHWCGYHWQWDSSTNLSLRVGSSASEEWHYNVFSPEEGKWHHIAMVHTGTKLLVYGDGKLTYSDTTVAMTNGDAPLILGARTSGLGFFDGLIDDVRIYNYARTADEIRLDYNAGMSVYFK